MPLQIYTHNDVAYYVDYRCKQFRSAVPFPEVIDFIDFDSDKGEELLCALIEDGQADFSKLNF